MHIRIWGVRGSLATPMTTKDLKAKLQSLLKEASPGDLSSPEAIQSLIDRSPHAATYGGNTSCLEVSFDGSVFILDAGTGIRNLATQLLSDGRATTSNLHIFLTHFHWDHICGFPFFVPIYQPGRRLDIWSGRSDVEELLRVQMSSAHFPVKWDKLASDIHCHHLEEGPAQQIAGAEVRILSMIHPDKAFGYRIDRNGRSICYLTDTEVSKNPNALAKPYADFVEGADVVVVDAMYGFLEYHEKINFGHSTIYNWIDFFKDSRIGELVIFHHDPNADDAAVTQLLRSARSYKDIAAPDARWSLSAAYEGQEWDLGK
ncbi:MAG: MBL fold metallo-hydrolase [Planctomycetota bacterium]|nr:MAG: MBL fold metallo-hydrolase [Planctomycetota bacterium]